ncbi:MAG TPA: ATP-grasp domain-containing protein [Streptosporangiaceae bacterium]|nr:ATP-grasp domain-containing protein [Streptosporangiaceae bacterium]
MSIDAQVYLVINRFDDEFGEYHRFVDQSVCQLAYITVQDGLAVLDQSRACKTVVLPSLDFDAVLPAARRIAQQVGGLGGIVGLSEYDLLTAAQLREAMSLPGYPVALVRHFKDKLIMKKAVANAGLRTPRYRAIEPCTSADELISDFGLPMILKPRNGAASLGVVLVWDRPELIAALAEVPLADYECEEYIRGDILHVDGIRRQGRYHFVSVSCYINTCLDFAGGRPLGSVVLDPGPRVEAAAKFAGDCLDALGLQDGPFHLELFEEPSGDLIFLEVGLRPGGGEIPFIHRDLFGIDLFCEAFRASLGLPAATCPDDLARPAGGGFVMVPEPRPFPSRVTSRSSLRGAVPGVYREIIPAVGEVFDGTGGYEHIGGRFHLRGINQDDVTRTVHEVIARYELAAEAVAPVGPR